MINITCNAQKHFLKLLANQKKGSQIRIFVNNPGTITAECGISYCLPNTVKKNDVKFQFKSFCVFVDQISLPFLKNAEVDLIQNQLETQLTLNAPYVKIYTIDNNAPLIERVQYAIQLEINPQLLNHGGSISLIEITKENFAILQFNGGCNGCAMANVTLKEGVEKKLLLKFPELRGIRDVTEHKHGQHSYY
ncbi:Fe/S biogenesis protein NfuA [Candidatus Ecksteinia adelgidicola]|nr:Fe/S biogenesis protein NfuA [Candidatus Ecksteinia adelgidicola]